MMTLLDILKLSPDNCIDLIATDPPYFQVKSCSWDNQWPDIPSYLSWLDEMLAEFWRVLKPNGSMYLFCGSRLAADSELLLRERFNVLNHIIWAKPSGRWQRQSKDKLRSYFPSTERILFAEHYRGPTKGKCSEFHQRQNDLKKDVFAPLINYFRQARDALDITIKDIHQVTGKQMSSHWFGYSQWHLPGADDYQKLQLLFQRVADECRQANLLNRDYADLVSEQDELRGKFYVQSEQTEGKHKDKVITDQQKVIDNAYTSIDIFDRVAAANANRNMQAEAQSQEKQIEYRTIIRKESTCNLYIPQPVSDGLLSHVYAIRESAMRSDPSITDTAGSGATSARRLTYCQAVEWIEPLLAALDKANGQLMDIRKADAELRHNKNRK